MPIKPLVSVIIPALNEAERISNCINSVRKHFPENLSYEILVGDHGSTDSTRALAESSGGLVIDLPGGTVGALRNNIARSCKGEILIFLDADTMVTASWGLGLQEVIGDLTLNSLQITGSMCVPSPDRNDVFVKYWYAKMPSAASKYLGTGHLITSKTLFSKLGGFDESLRSGEDYDFCHRASSAGAKLKIRENLMVIHDDYPNSSATFIRREIWHGAGDFRSWNAILTSKVAIVTLAFIALHAAVLLAIPLHAPYAILFFLAIAALLAALSILKFRKLDIYSRLRNISIFYLYLFGRSLAFFSYFVYPRLARSVRSKVQS